MKVKLLKKVRKQYSIDRVDDIGSNPTTLLEIQKEIYGLPFYLAKRETFWSCNIIPVKSFELGIDAILESIHDEYGKKTKEIKPKITKVWYNK